MTDLNIFQEVRDNWSHIVSGSVILAKAQRTHFNSLKAQGFTEDQALELSKSTVDSILEKFLNFSREKDNQ